ncbi:hypothetical protein BCR35DRAFT_315142 [Leucosporidium creatinivorum]|uniref:Uncharacterized protein n=1 Tax=Leucosporidium creatinivorum TaxID=106004 RepID=A0A1Y2ELH4_9BASI|nr:hypothetical protein BCR35DRAFT_315142 [Leucosporidium creatinivorum]
MVAVSQLVFSALSFAFVASAAPRPFGTARVKPTTITTVASSIAVSTTTTSSSAATSTAVVWTKVCSGSTPYLDASNNCVACNGGHPGAAACDKYGQATSCVSDAYIFDNGRCRTCAEALKNPAYATCNELGPLSW